jgi:hypothetical protein
VSSEALDLVVTLASARSSSVRSSTAIIFVEVLITRLAGRYPLVDSAKPMEGVLLSASFIGARRLSQGAKNEK